MGGKGAQNRYLQINISFHFIPVGAAVRSEVAISQILLVRSVSVVSSSSAWGSDSTGDLSSSSPSILRISYEALQPISSYLSLRSSLKAIGVTRPSCPCFGYGMFPSISWFLFPCRCPSPGILHLSGLPHQDRWVFAVVPNYRRDLRLIVLSLEFGEEEIFGVSEGARSPNSWKFARLSFWIPPLVDSSG